MTCQKQRFRTATEAKRSLRVLRDRRMRKDRGVHVYRCDECRITPTWHIGHYRAA